MTSARPVAPALELQRVSKRFGNLVALDDVSLTVRKGTIHALLGENGAGKTTLMHIAYGLVQPDSGEIRIRGQIAAISSPSHARDAGIGMVHQHFTLVPAMTVADNLALGGRGIIRRASVEKRIQQASARTGFDIDASAFVEDLPVGAQQRVEIAKAVMGDVEVLILDEPTAVLAPSEIDEFLAWLRSYADSGNSAVLITHKLREAVAVADDVTVLRRGRVTYTSIDKQFTVDHLATAMMGENVLGVDRQRSSAVGEIVLSCRSVHARSRSGAWALRDAHVDVHAGELLGVVGVEGSGQRELLRILAGRLQPTAGEVVKPDVVGFVPEDRHTDAVMLDRSVAENVALEGAGRRSGLVNWTTFAGQAAILIEDFDVRSSGPDSPVRSLSGGNQQKLVLARALTNGSRALVVENPTRGLDIRAAADVRNRLLSACASRSAVVFYSSDVDEVLSIASRIIVMYAGTLRETDNDREAVGRAMVGLGQA